MCIQTFCHTFYTMRNFDFVQTWQKRNFIRFPSPITWGGCSAFILTSIFCCGYYTKKSKNWVFNERIYTTRTTQMAFHRYYWFPPLNNLPLLAKGCKAWSRLPKSITRSCDINGATVELDFLKIEKCLTPLLDLLLVVITLLWSPSLILPSHKK